MLGNNQYTITHLSRKQLYQDYIVEEMSSRELASRYGLCSITVRRLLTKYNISLRSQAEAMATDRCKIKLSDATFNYFDSPEARLRQSLTQIRRFNDPTEGVKISLKLLDHYDKHPEACEEQSQRLQDYYKTHPLTKGEKQDRVRRAHLSWKNKNKHLRAIIRGNRKRPTSIEQILIDIIRDYNLPLNYNGNGPIIIDGLCPDFISDNGFKLVILANGEIYHQDPFRELRVMNTYNNAGYKVLVLEEREIHKGPNDYLMFLIISALSHKEATHGV